MNRESVDWRGYMPAVTTPFSETGELDLPAFSDLLEWLKGERMHGIAVAGTTGEWFSMNHAERVRLFAAAGDRLAGEITLLAGCSAFTPEEVVEYARSAAEAGFDGILLTLPPYVVLSEREAFAWYQTVSDAVDLPICVYNWPRGTGVDMSPTLLGHIAEIDNVVAIKNSTGNAAAVVETAFSLHDRVRIFGVPANEFGVMLVENRIADGTIGAGAVLGFDHPAFFEHIWAGEREAALECGKRDRALFDAFWEPDYTPRFGSQFAILKAALDLRGVPGGHVRPPLLPLSADEVERVRTTLVNLGIAVVS
jgi:4-hydroxy-tetrahydrodipicolinate synthase